ncbi:MAG: FAD-binding oxidoreductase [Planctomycetaceae bacterium]
MSIESWQPESVEELRQLLESNFQGPKAKVLPVGGGSSLPPVDCGVHLQTGQLNAVVDYPHRDMTITVEAGIRMAVLAEVLAEHGQRIPIEVPQPSRATLGGAIACNASGSTRYGHGTFRDYVIGISAIDGQGRAFSAGGRVVKNVAGYDLCKLLVGSEGALAVISQVTLRLKPLAASRRLVRADLDSVDVLNAVLETLNTSQTRPVLLDVLNPVASDSGYQVFVGFDGTDAETAWQAEQVLEELKSAQPQSLTVEDEEETDRLWNRLNTFQVAPPADGFVLRAQVLPSLSAKLLDSLQDLSVQLHGDGTMHVHVEGGPDVLDRIARIRRQLQQADGSLVVLNPAAGWGPEERLGPLPPHWHIVQQIKASLDPAEVLSPGWLDETSRI